MLLIFICLLTRNRLTKLTDDQASDEWSVPDEKGERTVYYDMEVRKGAWRTMSLDIGNGIFFTAKVFLGWLVAKYDVSTLKYTELPRKGSCRPKVSPDGTKVAYVCHDDDGLGDVFVLNTDGSGKRNMTPGRPNHHDYFPCFSPSGDMIVFSSSPGEKGKNVYQINTLDLRSGKIVEIFTADGNCSNPYWFP
jgi:tricorn protease-like protein